ncbi:hypothetical protein NDN08_005277 [Rhodosorus marinus]|uniref:Ribosome biogenesis protein NOP53 n=1 Tax=Rhodosorus marinus TaxID=101924 RepID=A0AAV8V4B3_9RHOD|nr:hypothetical protein NDN08_005277 [Rhodosorus marinus]
MSAEGLESLGIRDLGSGRFLCEDDQSEFSELRFAKRHALRLAERGNSESGKDGGKPSKTESADANEEEEGESIGFYARLRSTILDSNTHEEKSRRVAINGTDASQSVLPKLSSLPPAEKWQALKSEPVGDELVEKIRMQSTDSKNSLLKDLVKKAKAGRNDFVAKRRKQLKRYNPRLALILGSFGQNEITDR